MPQARNALGQFTKGGGGGAVELGVAYVSVVASAEGIGDSLADQVTGPVADAAQKSGQAAADSFATGMRTQGRSLTAAGLGLSAFVTTPIVGAIAGALSASIDFEQAFANVKRTVPGTTEQIAGLRQGLLDLAQEMPITREGLAKIAEIAGQLGVKAADVLQFTETVAKISTVTNLTADEVASSFGRIAAVMELPAGSFDALGSSLVALGLVGASTEHEILEMAQRISGAGHVVGLSSADVLGFASALSSVGVRADAGGSSISTAFIKIASAIEGNTPKLKIFAETAGKSTAEFATAFKEDAGKAMVSFIEGLRRVQDTGGNVFGTLDDLGLGTIRVRDALLRAAGAGDLLDRSLDVSREAFGANVALSDQYAVKTDTTSAKLQILINRVTEVSRALGDALAPVLIDVLNLFSPLIDVLRAGVDRFAEMDPLIKGVVLSFVALAAATGPLLLFAGIVATTIGALAGAAVVLVPLGIAAAIIAQLVLEGVGIVLLYQRFQLFREAVDAVGRVIRDQLYPIFLAAMDGIRAAVEAVVRFVETNWPKVQTVIAAVVDFIVANVVPVLATIGSFIADAFGTAVSIVVNVVGGLIEAFGALVSWVQTNWPLVQGAIGAVIDWLSIHVLPVVGAVVSAFIIAFQAVVSWVQTNWPLVQGAIGAVIDWLSANVVPVVGAIASALVTVFDAVVGFIVDNLPLIQSIIGVIIDVLDTVGGAIITGLGAVVNFVIDRWPLIQSVLATVISWIGDHVVPIVAAVGSALIIAFDSVVTWVSAHWPIIVAVLAPSLAVIAAIAIGAVAAFRFLVNWITTNWPTIQAVIGTVVSWLGDNVVPVVVTVANALTTAFGAVVGFVETNWPKVQEAIASFVDWYKDNVAPVVGAVGSGLIAIFNRILQVVRFVWPFIQDYIVSTVQAILAAVIPVAAVIGIGLIAAFNLIRSTVATVWPIIRDGVVGAINEIRRVVEILHPIFVGIVATFNTMKDVVLTVWPVIRDGVVAAVNEIIDKIQLFVAVAIIIWDLWGARILSIAQIIWDQIKNVIETALGIVRGIIEFFTNLINGDWGAAWDSLKGIVATAFEGVKETVTNALSALWFIVIDGLHDVADLFGQLAGWIGDVITEKAEALGNLGARIVQLIASGIANAPNSILDAIKDKIPGPDSLKDGAEAVLNVLIPGGATGFTNFAGGLALVGEQGPEIVQLPRGSNVFPHGTGPSGGGAQVVIQQMVTLSPADAAAAIAWELATGA